MKNQIIVNFFASVWSIVKNVWKWLTIKNIWMVLTRTASAIGIVFILWIVASMLYALVIFLGAFFATTNFSADNSWAHLANHFFDLSKMEMLMVIALAISAVNSILNYFKLYDLSVDVEELNADNYHLREEVKRKGLEIGSLNETIENSKKKIGSMN